MDYIPPKAERDEAMEEVQRLRQKLQQIATIII